jgi:glutaredoxin
MTKVIVYSKNNCPYCVQAKNQLKNAEVDFIEVNIEEDLEARDFIIGQGHRTMPQIYKDGKLFVEGGAQGLAKLSRTELKEKAVDFSEFKL